MGKLHRLISDAESIGKPFEAAATNTKLSDLDGAEVLIVFYEEQLASFNKAIKAFGGKFAGGS